MKLPLICKLLLGRDHRCEKVPGKPAQPELGSHNLAAGSFFRVARTRAAVQTWLMIGIVLSG